MVPASAGEHPGLGIVLEGAVAARAGRVLWVGPASNAGSVPALDSTVWIDARGGVVTPGLIDPHTHAVFAGSRHEEYEARLAGRPYLEILAAGGGILSTVRATRAASDRELVELTRARLDRMLALGVTTAELKSGYGLGVEAELRLLRIAREAGAAHPIRVVTTLLGAHALPDEHRHDRAGYVRLVIDEMIPEAARQGLADACDVYLERAAFSLDEARAILLAARKAGLGTKLHAGQFNDLGGGELAAELGALSADHLEELGDEGLRAMVAAGVVGVLLPGAALSLRGRFPDARRLLDAGLRVALATDCNPGTSHTENLPLMATLAVSQMGMTIDEALVGVTASAARALGLDDAGAIAPGHRADLTVWDVPDFRCLVYHFGVPHAARVIAGGRVVWPS
ncbi:MAG: imidazolonepropionase [Deltaproteobacteria bacterium]|nr:imidazolonepropionase [Deltaproteobacteria bacterium]